MATFVRFAERGPEWQDVKPVPQNDPPNSIVPIDYPPEYREVMDYLRALLLADERSERALRLTAEAIDLNAANYTAWHYRRRILESLGDEAWLRKEVAFINEVTRDHNSKNYQLWYHRQSVVGRLGESAGELDFVAEVLAEDAKNYHAFSYRQWLLKRFGLWESELAFVDALLQEDGRNNSAWNQRWFVLQHTRELSGELVRGEVAFAFSYIEQDPQNESPWTYAKGWLRKASACGLSTAAEEWRQARARAQALLLQPAGPRRSLCAASVALHGFIVEALEREGDDNSLQDAAQVCEAVLAGELDRARAKYWRGVVLARINAKLIQDITSPKSSNVKAAASSS